MMKFADYKVILWDFDGVIMDSMQERDEGFRRVLNEFSGEQVEALLKFHRENGGLSRYVKFRYFYEDILKESVTEEQVNEMAARFSEEMMKLLLNPELLIQDSVDFIKNNYQKYRFHIVSGSDGKELNEICQFLDLTPYFITIEGSPTPKKQLVADIIKNYGYKEEEMCLIGDSGNDKEAAEYNKIDFFGYNNPRLNEKGYYIKSFKE